jgi:hypothetical protein
MPKWSVFGDLGAIELHVLRAGVVLRNEWTHRRDRALSRRNLLEHRGVRLHIVRGWLFRNCEQRRVNLHELPRRILPATGRSDGMFELHFWIFFIGWGVRMR